MNINVDSFIVIKKKRLHLRALVSPTYTTLMEVATLIKH